MLDNFESQEKFLNKVITDFAALILSRMDPAPLLCYGINVVKPPCVSI